MAAREPSHPTFPLSSCRTAWRLVEQARKRGGGVLGRPALAQETRDKKRIASSLSRSQENKADFPPHTRHMCHQRHQTGRVAQHRRRWLTEEVVLPECVHALRRRLPNVQRDTHISHAVDPGESSPVTSPSSRRAKRPRCLITHSFFLFRHPECLTSKALTSGR